METSIVIIELMKEALQAMERRNAVGNEYKEYLNKGIKSLRQAIELAENQNPAFTNKSEEVCNLLKQAHDILSGSSSLKKLQWNELTTQEINNLYKKTYKDLQDDVQWNDHYKITKSIEAKLKEKNT